jgi:hypothetical protein
VESDCSGLTLTLPNLALTLGPLQFDVGTSSGMLHSGLWGGQLNPAYIPAPGAPRGGAALTVDANHGGPAHTRDPPAADARARPPPGTPLPPPAGTFYPSTGMTLRQRCVNAATLAATKVLNYAHARYGPISRCAPRPPLPPAC